MRHGDKHGAADGVQVSETIGKRDGFHTPALLYIILTTACLQANRAMLGAGKAWTHDRRGCCNEIFIDFYKEVSEDGTMPRIMPCMFLVRIGAGVFVFLDGHSPDVLLTSYSFFS